MSLNKRLMSSQPAPFVASENFKVVTWSGNATDDRAITVGFQPDMVWFKTRNETNDHNLSDSTRGATYQVRSNRDIAQVNGTDLIKSFTSTGFTIGTGGDVNASGDTYVAWCWKANGGTTSSNTDGTNIDSTVQVNADAGFSIVQFTTPSTFSGSNTVGHGLGATPDMILVKATSTSEDWYVYHTSTGLNKATRLNTTDAVANATYLWGTVNDTVFNPAYTSTSPITNIAYCFKSIDGFSKFGSYTGNGSTTGAIVETGFEPAFVMIKNTTSSGQDWRILDNKRNASNPRNCYLSANNSNAEECQYAQLDFLSNGFQVIGTDGSLNQNSSTMIYMAFAADPDTEAPTLASSFNIETWTGTGSARSITGLGFSPNLVWYKERSNTSGHELLDTLRGPTNYIMSSSSNAQASSAQGLQSFDSDGFSVGTDGAVNQSGETYVGWNWKADDNEPTIFGGDAIAIYKFEDNANDVTGTYNGTASNVTFGTGKYGNCAIFNGTNSQITTSYNPDDTKAFTWSSWINVTNVATDPNDNIFGTMESSAPFNGVAIFLDVNDIALGTGGSNRGNIVNNVSAGTWYHVAVTYNGNGTFKTYKDGSLVSTISQTPVNGGNFWFGDGGPSSWNNFDGKLDQIRLYEELLSDQQIENLYNETVSTVDDIGLSGGNVIVSANANAGFSIVKYDGSGVSGTKIPHGLSAAPNMILIKCTSDGSTNWIVHHSSLGNSKYLTLNDNSVQDTSTNWLVPSATTFELNNTFGNANTSGRQYIAYCWHSVSGYSAFGSYAGNGTSQTITTGFKPDFVMLRKYDDNQDWMIWDSVRDGNPKALRLEANNNDAEVSGTTNINFISTGFEFTSGYYNDSGQNSIYMAFKKNVPSNTTLANSFKAVTYTGNDGTQNIDVGFKPDLVWIKNRNNSSDSTFDHSLFDSQRSTFRVRSNSTGAQNDYASHYGGINDNGFQVKNGLALNDADGTYVAWCWKAGNTWQSNIDGTISSTTNTNTANGFSIIKYTGTGSNATIGHGLSSTPDAILIKKTSGTEDWYYHSLTQLGSYSKNLRLNTSDGESTSSTIVTGASATVINLGTSSAVNGSGTDYIAYCFHSVSGYSKFGSYTGDGGSSRSFTLLDFQPDFVMVKSATQSDGRWHMYDSVRGVKKRLLANSSGAEYNEATGGSAGLNSFDSTGWTIGNDGHMNQNAETYIYMAFKAN